MVSHLILVQEFFVQIEKEKPFSAGVMVAQRILVPLVVVQIYRGKPYGDDN